jgi:hypothetical protein
MSVFSAGPIHCFKCCAPCPTSGRIERAAVCPGCDADLHCCYNRRHYNSGAHNECNEQSEWVRDKDRANYCDYFNAQCGQPQATDSATRKQTDVRARFEDLFIK